MAKNSFEVKYSAEDFAIMQLNKEFNDFADLEVDKWKLTNWLANHKKNRSIEEILSADLTHYAYKRGEFIVRCKAYDEWKGKLRDQEFKA